MLKRQRILLGLIYFGQKQLDARVPRKHLMKSAFILSREYDIPSIADVFDFVPHNYGPFSFALYRDLSNLEKNGLVEGMEAGEAIGIPSETFRTVRAEIDELPWDVRQAIDDASRNCVMQAEDDLLRTIYAKYPWYAMRSKRQDLVSAPVSRPRAQIAIHTMGYEGLSVDSFFEILLKAGMARIVDVRANPISRKYGFAKKSMSSIGKELGIGYVHMPQLGIQSKDRASLVTREDYVCLFEDYKKRLPAVTAFVDKAAALVSERPSVLVCMERSASDCHRSRLADELARRTGLPVYHL